MSDKYFDMLDALDEQWKNDPGSIHIPACDESAEENK